MTHVAVHIEPVTAENLRKFAAILNDMANKMEPSQGWTEADQRAATAAALKARASMVGGE